MHISGALISYYDECVTGGLRFILKTVFVKCAFGEKCEEFFVQCKWGNWDLKGKIFSEVILEYTRRNLLWLQWVEYEK